MTKVHSFGPNDFPAQQLQNHLLIRVIRGLILFWCERLNDLIEARIAAQAVPIGTAL
jgi:hypothetical protein